ncbi:MAG: isocitrate lyase/phosphoenolpyruvate mutase family protein [Bacteroidota bacterium]
MTTFKKLHRQTTPLLIGNVWDVPSAKVAETIGFQAVGTSSAAIAKQFGYEDGEALSFSELLYVVKRIKANTNLPLSVDIESGYSRDAAEIANHIEQLANLGVVGVNLEDSVFDKKLTLLHAEAFAQTIAQIKKRLVEKDISIFLNTRMDTFLLGVSDAIVATQQRVKLYEEAGADGIFVPCLTKPTDIQAIVKSTTLPVNVMCMSDLPDFQTLQKLGVRRISMGNFVFEQQVGFLGRMLEKIQKEASFAPVFSNGLD